MLADTVQMLDQIGVPLCFSIHQHGIPSQNTKLFFSCMYFNTLHQTITNDIINQKNKYKKLSIKRTTCNQYLFTWPGSEYWSTFSLANMISNVSPNYVLNCFHVLMIFTWMHRLVLKGLMSWEWYDIFLVDDNFAAKKQIYRLFHIKGLQI